MLSREDYLPSRQTNSNTGPLKVRVAHDLHMHSRTQAGIRNADDEQGNKSVARRFGPNR
jgi:hypothetical protein